MKKGILIFIITFLVLVGMGCGEETQTADMPVQDMETESVKNNIENIELPMDDTNTLVKEESNRIKGIVQVQTDNQRGSGILWEKQEDVWYFVTASHVVMGLKQVEVYFAECDKLCVASVHCIEGLDLAFLQVDTVLLSEEVKEGYKECSEDLAEVKSGDIIFSQGYNAAVEMQRFEGTVWEPWIYTEDFENYMLLCQCEALPGMSGGAVFATDDVLVGIICGQNEGGMLAVLPAAIIEGEYALFINY